VKWAGGITFEFAANTLIPPGGRVVMVKHSAAFAERHAARLATITFALNTAGTAEYQGRLGNTGDTVTLLDANGAPIVDFEYDDDLPWPPGADGLGYSLVLKSPSAPPPDHRLPGSWAASRAIDGEPGADDPFGFAGDPAADLDGDGFTALLEYALGGSDRMSGDLAHTTTALLAEHPDGAGTATHLTLRFRRSLLAQHTLDLQPELSSDLATWTGGDALILVSEQDQGDGTSIVTYRSAAPATAAPAQFIRLRAAVTP